MIHAQETVSGGMRLVMSDGSIWFHPFSGGTPHYRDTLDHCRSRGEDHRAYGWHPRPERDWSVDQRAAYLTAWEN